MSEQCNEFEFWPSRFRGEPEERCTNCLKGWPPSSFRVRETQREIHRRLGQIEIMDRITNGEFSRQMENQRE